MSLLHDNGTDWNGGKLLYQFQRLIITHRRMFLTLLNRLVGIKDPPSHSDSVVILDFFVRRNLCVCVCVNGESKCVGKQREKQAEAEVS